MAGQRSDLMLGLGLDASGALKEAQRLADKLEKELGQTPGGAKSTDEMGAALRRAAEIAALAQRAIGAAMDEAMRAQEAARHGNALADALTRSAAAADAARSAISSAMDSASRAKDAAHAADALADALKRSGGAASASSTASDESARSMHNAAEAAAEAQRSMGGMASEAAKTSGAAKSADDLANALRRSGAAAAETKREMAGLEAASEQAAQAMSRTNPAKSLASARDVLDIRSFTAIQREIDQVNAAYKRLSDSGKLSSAELQHAAAAQQAALVRLNAEMGKFGTAGQVSAGQTAAAFRQLPMQLQDVFVSLAGGMNPLMVLTQQGPQITSSFGGVKETFKAITGAISPMAAGLMGGLAAVATLGAAYNQGSAEADAYAKALIMTGNSAGSTVGQMQQMAVGVSNVVGTQAAAAEAVATLAGTGRIAAADLERLTLVTVQWERATGQAVGEVAKQFADLGKAPLEASIKLNESMHYLTEATYSQIKALDEEGRSQEAARVAQEAYAAALEQRAGQITAHLGVIESAWRGVKDGAAAAWDAMLGIGRKQTIEGALAESADKIARIEANAGKSALLMSKSGSLEKEKARQRDLQIEASDAAKRAGNRSAEAKRIEAKIKWDKEGDKFASNKEKREQAITKARQESLQAGVSDAELQKRIAGIQDKFKDPKGPKAKSGIGAFNRNESADVTLANAQAKAALMAEVDATDAIRKELERRHSIGLDASGDYYRQLAALAERDTKSRLAAIDAEAAAEKARATKDPASAKASEARLVDIAAKRAHEVAQAKEKAADIGAMAEREALDNSRVLMQDWAKSWQDADKMAQQYAESSAMAAAQMIVDPLKRAQAEAEITARKIERDSIDVMLGLGNQIDILRGSGMSVQADALQVKLEAIRAGVAAEADRTRNAPALKIAQDYIGTDQTGIGMQVAAGFDAASQSLSAFVTGFGQLLKMEDAYGKAISVRGLTTEQIAAIESKHAQQQINSYGTMVGAAKGFFKEGSRGYKALDAAEKAFRAAELALAVRSAMEKIGLISSVTAAKVTGDAVQTASATASVGPEVAASMAKGQAAAVAGVANQASGDPYSAFFRIAAMAALMAGLGFAVKGRGGSASTPEQTQSTVLTGGAASSADRQQYNGTGTVLGDPFAKSESLKKSLDALTGVDTMTMQYSAQMLASLKSIEASMAGVSTQILRAGGITTGKNMGITTGTLAKNSGDPIANALGIGFVNDLAKSIPVLGGIISGLQGLWGKTTASITDAGLAISGTAAQMRAGSGINQYADVSTTTSSWFGLSKKTNTSTQMAEVSDEMTRQFGLIFGNVGESLQSAAGAMGQDAVAVGRRLADYVVEIPRLSLKGLTGDTLQEAVATAVGAKADEMARLIAPGLIDFQRIGEGYYETVIRVASSTEQAAGILQSLGVAQIDSARLQRKQADDMVAELVRESITLVERTAGGMSTAIGQIVDTMSGSADEIAGAYRKLRDARSTMQMMGMSGDGLTRSTISGAGGLDSLQSAMSDFEDKFFTDAEKAAFATKRIQSEFSRLGVEMPTTIDGFRSLVTGIDTSTESGQMLLGSILPLSGQFADLMGTMGDLGTTTTQLTSGIEDEINRIRGVIGQRDGQSVAGAQAAFTVATAQARAGDTKALDALPGLSQAMLKAAEDQSTTRADLVRLQAQTAASLQATLDTVRGTPVSAIAAPVAGVPGMIAPAVQAGATAAAPAAPTAQAGGGNSALLIELQALRTESASIRAELQALRAESASGLTTIATNTGRSARILDRVTAGGDTIQTEVVTP